ncbi:MAG: anthranilate synthase component II [Verrucomicrobiota bacterium]
MLLVVDNFDSFTYNLVQYFGQLGVEQKVVRNNAITADEALALEPEAVVLSPGPCTPNEAGVSLDIIAAFAGKKPILGVCLGHQSIGQYYGGKVIRAGSLMHGKTSPIQHQNSDVFAGMPLPFEATRYHSLVVERASFPDCLEITAETAEGEVMGLRHRELPIYGVQFHPESLATVDGIRILENFLNLAGVSRTAPA